MDICYESAWHLLTRIRSAMGQRDAQYLLSGIVELDDGYVGGHTRNGKRGRGTDKIKIVVAVSKSKKPKTAVEYLDQVIGIRARQTEVIVDWDENDTEINRRYSAQFLG